MKKRIQKPKSYAQCVTGHYVTLDPIGERPYDFELRNADVTYLDRHSKLGQIVEIKSYDYKGTNQDHIQLYAPEVRMYKGMITLKGFVSVIKKDGKVFDPEYGNPELPMRLAELMLRSECGLDDDGKWRED